MRKKTTTSTNLTFDFKSMPDYKEGNYSGCQAVLFGMRNCKFSQKLKRKLMPAETLEWYHNMRAWWGVGYGGIFNPRLRIDISTGMPEQWEYPKNQAFWAGAIDAGKSFLLLTPIDHYGGYISYTVHEMFWLEDNGYTFTPNSCNIQQTLAIPPNDLDQRSKIITDYLTEDYYDPKLVRRLSAIIASVKQQQNQMLTQFHQKEIKSLVTTPYESDKNAGKKRKRTETTAPSLLSDLVNSEKPEKQGGDLRLFSKEVRKPSSTPEIQIKSGMRTT